MSEVARSSFLAIAGALLCAVSVAQPDYKPPLTTVRTFQTIKLNADASTERVWEHVVRVETEQGIAMAGDTAVIYSPSLETVEVLEAYVIQPDGTRVQVAPEAIKTTDTTIAEDAPLFSDKKRRLIIFPKLQVGSQTVYRVRNIEHTPLYPGYFEYRQSFSPNHRIEDFVFEVSYPEGMPFEVTHDRVAMTQVPAAPGMRTVRFEYKNLVPLPPEPGQAASWDFGPRFGVTNFGNWKGVAEAYRVRANPKAVVTDTIRHMAQEISGDSKDTAEIARKLYHWVSREIRYVGIYLGAGDVVPHDAEWILENRYGDCKDHVTLLEALLAAKGIESHAVLISTGDSYRMDSLPMSSYFDHVITYIPALNVYLDSTAEMLPFGAHSSSMLDKTALNVVTGQLVTLPRLLAEGNSTASRIKLKVLRDGRIQGSASESFRGPMEYAARFARADSMHMTNEANVKNVLSRYMETGNGTIDSSSPRDLETPFKQSSEFTLDETVNLPGPGAFTIPVGVAAGRIRGIATGSRPQTRTLPFLCGSFHLTEEIDITAAPGMKITRIPANVSLTDSMHRYRAIYKRTPQGLMVRRELTAQRPGRVCTVQMAVQAENFLRGVKRDIRAQVFYE